VEKLSVIKIAQNCSQVPYERCFLLQVIEAVQQESGEPRLACSLKKQFDRGLSSKLLSKTYIRAFFSNVTMVLPLSGLVGGDTGAFAGPRGPPLIGQ
jgi:hypothetical protein